MERWALVSGLQRMDLYEQIQSDLKRLWLGDLMVDRNCNALLGRLQTRRRTPECIYGWWEDQLLAEHGYRGERHAENLRREQTGR